MTKFSKLAEFLGDRYVEIQFQKTASEPKTNWDRLRPENEKRPGMNWWSGLGLGSAAAGAELGIGSHGATEELLKLKDKSQLARDPFGNATVKKLLDAKNPALKKGSPVPPDTAEKFIRDLFKAQGSLTTGKKDIGGILSRNISGVDPTNSKQVTSIMDSLNDLNRGAQDHKLLNRWVTLTADPAKQRDMVKAFSKYVPGRTAPSTLTRLGRMGRVGGVGALLGAYVLPSLASGGKALWNSAPSDIAESPVTPPIFK